MRHPWALARTALILLIAGAALPLAAQECMCPWVEVVEGSQLPAGCPTHEGCCCCTACEERIAVCAPPGGTVTVAATFNYGVPTQDCVGDPCTGTRRFWMSILDSNESEEPPYEEGFEQYIEDLSPGQSATTTLSFTYVGWPVDNHNADYYIDATNLSTGAVEYAWCDRCCYRIECL